MNDNFVKAEEVTSANAQQTQQTQQTFSLNESTVNYSQVEYSQQQAAQDQENKKANNKKERKGSVKDDKNNKSTRSKKEDQSTKWSVDDKMIKDYFNAPKESQSQIVYLDVDTSGDLSFLLSDFEIICFDTRVEEEKKEQENKDQENKEQIKQDDNEKPKKRVTKVKGLKRISTNQEYYEDIEKKKKFAKNFKNFKPQNEILIDVELKQLEKNPAADKKYSEIELEHEQVTRVVLSDDKSQIYLGTSFGRVVLLKTENFEVQGVLQNILDSPVTDITSYFDQDRDQNYIFIGHEDGQLNKFTKANDTEEYSRNEIIASTDFQERFKPKLKCELNHRLIKLTKKPQYYDENKNLSCSQCDNEFKDKEQWFHCMICKFVICCDCSNKEKFQTIQTQIEEKDKDGIDLVNKSKEKEINCDKCKQQNLQNQKQWYHREEPKYNKCVQCPSKWFSQESNEPKCCLDHKLELIKEKKDEKDYKGTCAECETSYIQKSGLWYHCNICKFDLCYYCYKNTPVRAMRYDTRHNFLFYVQKTKDYQTFLVCQNLDDNKEFGREIFNEFWAAINSHYLNLYQLSNNFVIMLSDNCRSFKCVSLKKNDNEDKREFKEKEFQIKHQGPEKITEGLIVNIHVISEDLIIFGDHYHGCVCYNVKGNEVEQDKVKEPLFFMDCYCSIQDIKKCKLLKFDQKYNNYTTQFFDKEARILLSHFDDGSNFLKLKNLLFRLVYPQQSQYDQFLMTEDKEHIVAYWWRPDDICVYEISTHKLIFKTRGFDIQLSQHDKQLYYNKFGQQLCSFNFQNKQKEDFKDLGNLDYYQLSKNQSYIYIKKFDEEKKKQCIMLYDLEKKEKKYQYEPKFDESFSFVLSNGDEDNFILIQTEKWIMKLLITKEEFKEGEKFDINLDWGNLRISPNNKYIVLGGNSSNKFQIIAIENMKEVGKPIDVHLENDLQFFFTAENKLITKTSSEYKYWDMSDIKSPQDNYSCKGQLQVITDQKNQSSGFLYNGEIKSWDDEIFLAINSDDFLKLKQNQKEEIKQHEYWIEGPFYLLLPEILLNFDKQDFEQQVKMLPFLLQFVVYPYRFTYFEKLVFDNHQKLIKEVLNDKNAKYLIDINGNHPLSYALKRQNFETINLLLDYFVENPQFFSLLSFTDIINVLQVGSSKISDFFESSAIKIMEKRKLGKKKETESDKYFILDPRKKLNEDEVEKNLCDVKEQDQKNSDIIQDQTQEKSIIKQDLTKKKLDEEQDASKQKTEEQKIDATEMLPIVFYQTTISLSLDSKQSTEFLEALSNCPQEEIFETTFVQRVIDYKWILVKPVARFFLFIQSLFLILVTIHSFQPGIRYFLYILQGFAIYFLMIELIILKECNKDYTLVSKSQIVIIIMTTIYCLQTLNKINYSIDEFLPFINFVAWIGVILELQQFDKMRQFVCVFFLCIDSIKGFLIFLFLMLCTFASTQNMLIKNDIRQEKLKLRYGNDTEVYFEQETYSQADATVPLDEDLLNLWYRTFDTWIAIVKGDYAEEYKIKIKYQIFVLLLTFIANVTLLNLIVAIMSDAYGEVMTSIVAKKSKNLNYQMIRYEKVQFWRNQNGIPKCLIWVDYANEIVVKWKSQTDTIISSLKKSQQELEKSFKNIETNLVKSQQGIVQQISTNLQGRFDTLKTQFLEPLQILENKMITQMKETNQNQIKPQQYETSNDGKIQQNKQKEIEEIKTHINEMKISLQNEMKIQQDEMKIKQDEMKNSLTLLQEQTSLILTFMKEINNKTE